MATVSSKSPQADLNADRKWAAIERRRDVAPAPRVGDVVEAQWAIGPAQRGSGWIEAKHITEPKRYVISDDHGFGGFYYVQQSPDSGRIGIHRSEFILVGQEA